MMIHFPLPIFPSFLKVDFSDLPALIAAFLINPLAGVAVVFIKNLINIVAGFSDTGGIGEISNFIIGTAFVLPASFVYQKNKTKKGAIIGLLAGIASMTVFGALSNYYIVIPFYSKIIPFDTILKMCSSIIPAVDSLEKIVLYSIVPFNILKGTMASILALLLYKRLSHFFKN